MSLIIETLKNLEPSPKKYDDALWFLYEDEEEWYRGFYYF